MITTFVHANFCNFGRYKTSLKFASVLLCVFSLFVATSFAQLTNQSNLRVKVVFFVSDTTFLDSNTVVPGSLQFGSHSDSLFKLLQEPSRLVWMGKEDAPDSILCSYRVMTFNFTQSFRKKDPSLINEFYTDNPFSYIPKNDRFIKSSSDDIKTLGNISRGIGFGNRQDVVVNSNLNLRMTGKIQDKITLIAAISDDNNPIQPQGNTQQIQDFDRVFIQLVQDSSVLTAGDFQMSTPSSSYFMKYNKKSRGMQLLHKTSWQGNAFEWQVDGAMSRGRFSRNTITGIEGNQGPYRLQGANGELFIVVISGTEQVYLDGELLTRGEQNDYVIDYNSGELTFMPRQVITKYSRMVVEFQYSDQSYARSVIRTGGAYTMGKVHVRANYYSEQDHKNQPFQQNLDIYDSLLQKSARQILAEAGDAELVFMQRADTVNNFNNERIQYIRKDTLGFSIFSFAPSAEENITYYSVTFSYVGQGNGNYIQKLSNANGKVFEWVAPVNGQSVGIYGPVEILAAPKRRTMLNVGVDVQLSESTITSIEVVQSVNDKNTLSKLDASDDIGYGIKFGLADVKKLKKGSKQPWVLTSKLSYEFTQDNFQYIERYRDVEFERKWNRTLLNEEGQLARYDEHISSAIFQLNKGKNFEFFMDQSLYQKGASLGGYAQTYRSVWRKNRYTAQGGLQQQDAQVVLSGKPADNVFQNYFGSINRRGKIASIQAKYQAEHSSFNALNDSLFAQSYRFNQTELRLYSGDSIRLFYNLTATQRRDFVAKEGSFEPTTDGRTANLTVGYTTLNGQQFNLTSVYRELDYLDTSLSPQKSDNTIQGRLEMNLSLLKSVVKWSSYYQVGSGQEQRREYSYYEVGGGNGAFIWNDYNNNDIQELNEFEVASGLDQSRANFIRQYLPTQGFISSYSSELNQNLRIQPLREWRRSSNKGYKLLARFSNVSSIRIQKKVTDGRGSVFLNPLPQNVQDSALLSSNASLRSVFSFNQASPIFGMDYQ
ncbi:MAG: hypothetical protein ACI83I_002496, partial [Bacteroidia bacterium]